ncbi:MAG: ABC transporter permease subunit [Ornithinimicrobium sp.]|jgi:ABC-2 type transport system permease protein|uniref:ABC transporter permease subunit n=1 Tax=Ornithinimicrobium sp. TaxID=1977084 RepID=UPI0017E6E263|nr:ABC transporter permease subunit [Actinomycetota bacterium]
MNVTISRLALRSLFGQKRGLLLLALPVLLIGLSVVTVLLTDDAQVIEPITLVFGLGLVLPLVSLLVSTGVLGPEIEDGSLIYLLATPVSRLSVAVSKLAVAAAVTVLLGAGSVLLSALILDPAELAQALALGFGATVAGVAYCALFVALSALLRHGTVAGLIYVLVFEGLLASWLSGLRYISVGSFGRRIAGSLTDNLELLVREMSLVYAVLAALVVIVGGALFAGSRLRSFELRGED